MDAGGARRPLLGHTEEVMGTVISFRMKPEPLSDADAGQALKDACAALHRSDEIFSTWKHQSPISRLRRGELSLDDLPPEVNEVLALCLSARRVSEGWFDPWAMPGGIDPTGLVKGWAIEQALSVLRQAGVGSALVNGGGDIAVLGGPGSGRQWRVGIRHPWRKDALACVLQVDRAVATSATYERGAHLVDPHTGQALARAASATVTGLDLAMADALATALAVAGPEHVDMVRRLPGYDAYVIGPGGEEVLTEGVVIADA
jgi:thiamine biosynthesis lipoprotein